MRQKSSSALRVPSSFTDRRGRRFRILPGATERTPWGPRRTWTIYYAGAPAGTLIADQTYREGEWHATITQLRWRYASDAPTGIGFDVAAFTTSSACLVAWARSANEILDWHSGRPTSTPWSGGVQSRGVRSRRDEVESVGHHGYEPVRHETPAERLRRLAERRRRYRALTQSPGEQGPGYDVRRKRRSRRNRR